MPTEIKMPQLGESVHEGTIGRWLKRPGEPVAKYEALVEVITDKVNVEMPSPVAGVLEQILAQEGDTVAVGTPIALLKEQGAASPSTRPPTGAEAARDAAIPAANPAAAATRRDGPPPAAAAARPREAGHRLT